MSQKAVSTNQTLPMGHVFLTSQEVCDLLRVCPKTLKNWRKRRAIEFIRRGRNVLFRRETVERFLAGRTVKAA
jgi:excisionase family DNA binding protein